MLLQRICINLYVYLPVVASLINIYLRAASLCSCARFRCSSFSCSISFCLNICFSISACLRLSCSNLYEMTKKQRFHIPLRIIFRSIPLALFSPVSRPLPSLYVHALPVLFAESLATLYVCVPILLDLSQNSPFACPRMKSVKRCVLTMCCTFPSPKKLIPINCP